MTACAYNYYFSLFLLLWVFDVSNKTSAVPAQSANAHASTNHYNNSPSSSSSPPSSSQISSNATHRPYYIDQRLPIKSTTTATKPSSPNNTLDGPFPHITHVQKQNHPPPTANSHKVMSTTSSMLSVSSSSSPTFTQPHTPFNVGAASSSSSSMNCSSSSHNHAFGATAATDVTDGAGSFGANATTTPTTSNNNRANWSIKLSTTCKQVGVTLGQHVRNLAKPRNTNPKQERYTHIHHKSTTAQKSNIARSRHYSILWAALCYLGVPLSLCLSKNFVIWWQLVVANILNWYTTLQQALSSLMENAQKLRWLVLFDATVCKFDWMEL